MTAEELTGIHNVFSAHHYQILILGETPPPNNILIISSKKTYSYTTIQANFFTSSNYMGREDRQCPFNQLQFSAPYCMCCVTHLKYWLLQQLRLDRCTAGLGRGVQLCSLSFNVMRLKRKYLCYKEETVKTERGQFLKQPPVCKSPILLHQSLGPVCSHDLNKMFTISSLFPWA
ncbi:UNVERIFIED_CONTAM: hypothetical protein K2H54_066755 [Gekko kuhli]